MESDSQMYMNRGYNYNKCTYNTYNNAWLEVKVVDEYRFSDFYVCSQKKFPPSSHLCVDEIYVGSIKKIDLKFNHILYQVRIGMQICFYEMSIT